MRPDRARHLTAYLMLLGACMPARAVDVVPMAGLRFGGDLSNSSNYSGTPTYPPHSLAIDSSASYGGIVDFPLPADFAVQAIEVYYSRQQTTLQNGQLLAPPVADLDVSVMQMGVVAAIPTADPRLTWLVTAAGGATRFETSAGSETRPSIGVGAAVRWMVNEHFGMRADLRALIDLTNSGGSVLACNNGSCNYSYAGTVVVQGEASIGIVLRF